jgi:hypothetical protein
MVRVFFLFLLISANSGAQIVKVDLTLESMSSRITSYQKDQFEKMLLDSAIKYCKDYCRILGSSARFYQKAYCADSINADYRLSFLVRDSAWTSKKNRYVESSIMHEEFIEEKEEKTVPNQYGFGASYSMIEKDEKNPSEIDHYLQLAGPKVDKQTVTDNYFKVLYINARGTIDACMPMNLDLKLKPRNISKEQLNDYESYRDVIVEFDVADSSIDSVDVARMEILINNAFFVRQDFYYRIHRKKKTYFNYYLSTKADNNERTLLDNPLTFRFVLMKSDTNKYRLVSGLKSENEIFKTENSKEFYFSEKDLKVFPSKINSIIHQEASRFTYKYLD